MSANCRGEVSSPSVKGRGTLPLLTFFSKSGGERNKLLNGFKSLYKR